MAGRAAAILAFSHDPKMPLEGVTQELQMLKNIIGRSAAMQVDDYWKPTRDEIQKAIGKYNNPDFDDALHIFHFAGHASATTQQWNDDDEDTIEIRADKLAEYLGKHNNNIKLVFLNACSTEAQAKAFFINGAKAVIATTQAVGDALAAQFAVAFYKHFTDLNAKRGLKQAFEAAWTAINFEDNSIKRDIDDNLGKTLSSDKNLYQLYLNPEYPDIACETFDLWQKVVHKTGAIPVLDDPTKAEARGVHESAYLLCDRADQQEQLLKILESKLDDSAPEPCFVVIRDEEKHCPELIARWLQQYGIRTALSNKFPQANLAPEFWKSYVKEIDILSPKSFPKSDWNDPNNPERDLFKHKLFDSYRMLFGESAAEPGKLQSFPKENYPLIVVQQRVDFERWGQSPAALQHFAMLMEYYMGEFSEKVLHPFSPRLLVMFYFSYADNYADPRFEKYFKDLCNLPQHQKPCRFYSVSDFDYLLKSDLDAWQDDHFKETFFKSGELLAKENPLTMFTAQKELKTYISRFNESKKTSANV